MHFGLRKELGTGSASHGNVVHGKRILRADIATRQAVATIDAVSLAHALAIDDGQRITLHRTRNRNYGWIKAGSAMRHSFGGDALCEHLRAVVERLDLRAQFSNRQFVIGIQVRTIAQQLRPISPRPPRNTTRTRPLAAGAIDLASGWCTP